MRTNRLPSSLGLALSIALNQVWDLVLPPWLLFPLLATAVMATGLLYPHVSTSGDAPDVSEIMRCVAVFVGIFQASTVSTPGLSYCGEGMRGERGLAQGRGKPLLHELCKYIQVESCNAWD